MPTLPIRLAPGDDLRGALEQAVAGWPGGSAFVVAGIGSLAGARIRYAAAAEEVEVDGPLEIVSLSGSLSPDGAHLHVSVSDAAGRVCGGHLGFGSPVRTTAEVLLAPADGWRLARVPDAATGYRELRVEPRDPGPAPSATGSRDRAFDDAAAALGHSFDGELQIGGHYAPLVRDGTTLYVSGQVPRVGSTVVVTGPVGTQVPLADAQRAAKISAMRALKLLQRELGSLDRVRQVLRITVFVQTRPGFAQHSEVADGASDLLHAVLGEAGRHTRTSVGVATLPKNASVELDLIAAAD